MTSTTSLFGQVATGASLCGPIARQLTGRASLHDVARQMLDQLWRERALSGPPVVELFLARREPGSDAYQFQPLVEVLIARYCQGQTLNLSPGLHRLTLQHEGADPAAAAVDMAAVEALLNDCAPFLIEEYKHALGHYWNARTSNGQSRWHWLIEHLRGQLSIACELELQAKHLSGKEAATALAIQAFPEAAQRRQLTNLKETQVALFAVDPPLDQGLDPELASALLIARDSANSPAIVLVFTLAGGLYRFDSREQFVASLANSLTGGVDFGLGLFTTDESVFMAQAALLLEQQLKLIDAWAKAASRQPHPEHWLPRRLEEATSLVSICSASEREKRLQYRALLPDWLRRASSTEARLYVDGLLALATVQRSSAGQSFLAGLANILDYTRDALRAAIVADQALSDFAVEDIEIINHRVTAAAAGIGGELNVQGTITPVHFSLVQFALENLAALRPGHVEIRSRSGAPIPAWLNLDYLKGLVARLNIGQVYPDLLQSKLLDQPQEAARRQQLFSEQLRVQLPLLALEKSLRRENGFSAEGYALVNALLQGKPAHRANCRPLAFIRAPGAAADTALNAYLIVDRSDASGRCVLYRPSRREPLHEFASPQAFFEKLCEPGALQDDILARLDESARPVFANGGFDQPHSVRFLPGDEFAPLSVPAPARLSEAVLEGDVLAHVYRSSARELVNEARRLSVSNQENRWIALEAFGWLMFNTFLPLLSGPLAVSAWMLQFFHSLQQSVAVEAGKRDSEQLVDLLLNLALILFSFKVDNPGVRIAPEPFAPLPREPAVARVLPAQREVAVTSPSGAALGQLEFGWALPSARLSAERRAALQAMRSLQPVAALGRAIPHGPLQGLFIHGERLWAQVEGALYEVCIVDDGLRITDADGALGPWLQRQTDGHWTLDLGLRLKGGMPLGRRIERLRESNRQQVQALEQALEDDLPRRLQCTLDLKQDLDSVVAAGDSPTTELLERYHAHLREHLDGLGEAHRKYKALNQLKSQANYRQVHAHYLYDRGSVWLQLLFVVRSLFTQERARLLRMRWLNGEDQLPKLVKQRQSAQYQALIAGFEKSQAQVEEIVAAYDALAALKAELADALPTGPGLLKRLQAMIGRELPLKAWRSCQIGLLTSVIVNKAQSTVGALFLVDTVKSARIGLQMEQELEAADAQFTYPERLQLLDSTLRHYASAIDGARNYRAGMSLAGVQGLLDKVEELLLSIQTGAERALADLIRNAPSKPETAPSAASSSRMLIRTRHRGMLVGQRRSPSGSQQDVVVIIDPIEQQELGRYEPSAEAGVWQPVEPARPHPTASAATLAPLVERATPLLAEAELQMQRARVQARMASIPVEMEEILRFQSRPLDDLSAQIESALTAGNNTDLPVGGADAVRVARALSDKAMAMRQEGQRLRVSIIKSQPPTAHRISYLKGLGEVTIAALEKRKPTRRRKGRAADFLDEYVIRDSANKPLWYAHFHYSSVEAADLDFSAAHLKTVEQRFDAGQYQASSEQDDRKVIQVYRSRIDRAMATALFLPA
ncbi:hypothetical protein DCO48_01505 [Pseudomonas sp. SDI]|uniref:dermonecrotic toxin domain-containing protein n=1 Tax=Pseudomonas sp. SDI TaxID=2170734 RepID=UPI000DE6D95C|nr:hypothetical protein [Pseudomonas sp. SDI]PWB35593.1 hypothetical protein DCO48_01505 [Pseudomonas sp. SDI]